jgi:hypothetical protein
MDDWSRCCFCDEKPTLIQVEQESLIRHLTAPSVNARQENARQENARQEDALDTTQPPAREPAQETAREPAREPGRKTLTYTSLSSLNPFSALPLLPALKPFSSVNHHSVAIKTAFMPNDEQKGDRDQKQCIPEFSWVSTMDLVELNHQSSVRWLNSARFTFWLENDPEFVNYTAQEHRKINVVLRMLHRREERQRIKQRIHDLF